MSEKSILTIGTIAGIILIATTSLGAYYLGLQAVVESQPPVSSPQPTLTPSTPMASLIEKGNYGEWMTYKGTHYPYKLSYPDTFKYENRNVGVDKYAGYREQPFFSKAVYRDLDVDAFYLYISQNKEPLNFVFDQEPTGEYVLDGVGGVYAEMPQGYADGAASNPAPMTVVQIFKDETLYKIVFIGTSSINDPLIQAILDSFEWTD